MKRTITQAVTDHGASGKYFHILLNMADDDLNPFQYRLLGHYRRVCGENGTCFEATPTTARITRMSVGKVVATRRELEELGYVTIEKRGAQDSLVIRLTDRMAENVARYSKRSPHEHTDASVHHMNGTVHHMNGAREVDHSLHEPKKNIYKNTEEEEQKIAPNGAAENSVSIPSPSKSKPSNKAKPESKSSQGEKSDAAARISEVIKAWIDGLPGGAPASNPYKNKTIRDQAAALVERGVPLERVTQYTREQSGESFWRGRLLPFHHMANNIGAWLLIQPTYATNGATRPDSTPDEAVTGGAVTADDLAAWDALEQGVLNKVSIDQTIKRIRRQA